MADRNRKRGVKPNRKARSGAGQVVPWGLAQETIVRLQRPTEVTEPGKAGRPRLIDRDASLLEDLERLLQPHSLAQAPLVWTCRSTRDLADELAARGHQISQRSLVGLLHQLGFELRGKHKRHEEQGAAAADAQLERILRSVLEFRRRRQPMVFMEVQRLREHRKASPSRHDQLEAETARHATDTLKQWWQRRGRTAFPRVRSLLVVASYRGPGAAPPAVWVESLKQLARSLDVELQVRHFPAATTRWTDLSGRVAQSVTYRGRPALSVAVHTIAAMPQRLRLTRARAAQGRNGKNGKMVRMVRLPAAWNYTVAGTSG